MFGGDMEKNSEILIYQNENGDTKVDVRFFEENVWITQAGMAMLFNTTSQNITQHIKNIYESNELDTSSTCKSFLQVQKEGERNIQREIKHYNLDMIISVGYRVKSTTAIHFRQWATKILKEYLKKGFAMDDERLKQKNNNYFDDLLERIRDIRSSEKVFYSKILDIYATSIDYDSETSESKTFLLQFKIKCIGRFIIKRLVS